MQALVRMISQQTRKKKIHLNLDMVRPPAAIARNPPTCQSSKMPLILGVLRVVLVVIRNFCDYIAFLFFLHDPVVSLAGHGTSTLVGLYNHNNHGDEFP